MGQAVRAEINMDQIIGVPGPYELARLACKLSKITEMNPPVDTNLMQDLINYGSEMGAAPEPETLIELERPKTLSGLMTIIDAGNYFYDAVEFYGVDSPQSRLLNILKDQTKEVDDGEGGMKIQGISREDLISAVAPVSKKVTFDQRTGTASHE